jgi:hypothetical protein
MEDLYTLKIMVNYGEQEQISTQENGFPYLSQEE